MRMRLATIAVVCGCLIWGGSPAAAQETAFMRGDVNQDGGMDLSDSVAVLIHLFVTGKTAPCEKAADLNDDGSLNLADAVYGLQYLFSAGPEPPPPFLVCGQDPTPDTLTCEESPCGLTLPQVVLTDACSADPVLELDWEVTNLDPIGVTLDWVIEGTAQSGTVDVPASDTVILTTLRVPGTNELVLSYFGREVARLEQVKVIISEIMASNAESLADEDDDSSDWIELHVVHAPCGSIDLRNWYLTDQEDLLAKWRFPSVSLDTGDYLVVFASDKDRSEAGHELHTNFNLDKNGEYLALVAADGETIVDELEGGFPEQVTDVSYGLAQWTQTLVEADGSVRYHVPTSGDAGLGTAWTEPGYAAAGWNSGQLGLGFSGIQTVGFDVTCVKATIEIDSLATAEDVLSTPGQQSQVWTETASVIDYFNSGGSGNYAVDNPFPGLVGDVDDFVVEATGTVMIPQAGPWSFGVNSDDGFSLELTNGAQNYYTDYPQPRGPADTIQVFNIAQAGPYDLRLVFYERGGGAEVELFAAAGSHPSFNYDHFDLVGDTANGGLGLLGFAADIATDVGSQMRNKNASIWLRATFTIADASVFGGLLLRMKYEDGFTAFLNGQEVASRNAPATLQYNSRASADRPLEDVPLVEEINLTSFLPLLVDGTNVLAIHALNETVSDSDFLILPELIAASSATQVQYMATPTPGTFNVAGSVDFVRSVRFSVDHGFYDAGFSLALSTPTPGAQIRYTLDGSTPTSTSGMLYTVPRTINTTTVIRAIAYKPDYLDSAVTTRSYIFVSDVIGQSPSGQAPGAGWPTGSVNGQVLDYGMDPDIVNNARWAPVMEDALLDISTISLVTDLKNLFDPAIGIYVNAQNDGRAWERRTSVELLNPDGTPGFAVDAGLRIRGAFSRSGGNPKHAFRLIFRNVYGTGKLQYALFGGEGVDTFDKVDLRTSQNNSWAYQGSSQNTLIRDVFSRDVQRDMHQPYTRSRYYHLYINGHYWGVFQSQERADADYAESYLGGHDWEYDTIKNDSSGSRALHATNGTIEAYWRLYDKAAAGFTSDAALLNVLGLRADGTPDPSGEQLVNPENLIDYMICTYYTGDPDAPVSCWAHFSNNVFAIYNHDFPEGFTWYRHDAEHSLGANGGVNESRLLTDPTDRSIGSRREHFNPAWLNLRLTQHPEYRLWFADRVCTYFFNGGILSSQPNIDRWAARVNELELAIIAESARWGDAKTHPPRDKDDWEGQNSYMLNTFFPQRTQIVTNNMRSVNMFPQQAIVSFNQHGGEVPPGFQLLMSQSNGTPGIIYYTTDGSDPRLWGGGINPDADIFEDDTSSEILIDRGSTWRYKDDGSNQGTAWRGTGFNDTSWAQGPAELGYGDGGEDTVVSYGPDDNNKYATTYFRHTFTVTDAADITELTLGIVRDDGAVVYLNGVEAIPRINMPGGTITYQTYATDTVGGGDESTFFTYDVNPGLLVEGTNVIAVEIHQGSGSSSDISFDLELIALIAGTASPPIELNETTTVRARVRSGSSWGAMTEARFWVGIEGLVINEVMASNRTTLEDPVEPGEFPDWIELYNGTAATIDLSGMYLTDDLQDLMQWQFAPGVTIDSGQHLIIYADDDGTQGTLHTNYQLSLSGEPVALVDSDGVTIIDSIIFNAQLEDVSYGRYPDGGATWGYHQAATPGEPNAGHSP